MDDDLWREGISLGGLVVFTLLLVIGMITTTIRRIGLAMKGAPSPKLLPRDLILFGGLSFPFVLILASRATDTNLRGELWWIALTTIPQLIAAAVYVYYEIFVIGQPVAWRSVVRSLWRRVR